MKWLRKLSLYYRVNGVIIGNLLLLSLIIGAVVIQTTVNLLEQQIDRRGAEIGTSLAALSSNDILLDDRYALFERINKSKSKTEDVRYILVADYAGRMLAHTFGSALPAGLPIDMPQLKHEFLKNVKSGEPSYMVTKYDSNEGIIREITVPIENGAVGFLRIGMSEQSTQRLLRETMHGFFITTLLICVLAVGGATHLAHYIIKPIQTLSFAAKEIRLGNYSAQALVNDEAEVGHLAAVFNDMARSLQEKEKENNRLLAELRAKEAVRTTLMNRLFTVQEDERKRISRELHDETSQSLASLLAYMKLLESKLDIPAQRELIIQAKNVAVNVLGNVRKMAVELRPPVLDDLGIITAMAKYINEYKIQHNLAVSFKAVPDIIEADATIALALYRILQESLTNVAKHAYATCVQVDLVRDEDWVVLTISDNGRGFGPLALVQAYQNNRLGICGMRERVELLRGQFAISANLGQGTKITVKLPLNVED